VEQVPVTAQTTI